MINKLVEIAVSQIGVKEEGGNNKGAQIIKYQQATWLTPGAWPWCAAFVCWVVREWLKLPEVKTALKLTEETAKTWRPRTAGAFDFVNWAKQNRLRVFDEKEMAKAGDIVIFDFSHIGIVIEDQKLNRNYIVCVEGNTNEGGARDSDKGDGVCRKVRSTSIVRAYIRIK